MRRVVIIESHIKQYRVQFLTDLAAKLRAAGLDLKVVYSEPLPSERARADCVDLEPQLGIKVPAISLLGERILLQPSFGVVRDADLVIVEQANRLVMNHFLVGLASLGLKRVAYWGHGYNRQGTSPAVSEWVKAKLLRQVNWWFAYTRSVTEYLVAHGVDPLQITTVQNTVDTTGFASALEALQRADLAELRARLGVDRGSRVGIFCGALTAAKEVAFLLDAAERIHERLPEFHLLVVGDGPVRSSLASRGIPFVHFVGPIFGQDRAPFFALSEVMLIPALVGLAIVDGFCAGLPLVTTDLPTHGPEIDYLKPGENGVIARFDVSAYSSAVVETLEDRTRLREMSAAARTTAAALPLSRMVETFAEGVVRCLDENV